MAITRGMAAKLNQDARSSRKRPKMTVDNDYGCNSSSSWSYLIHDILIAIISRLGVIDFVAFSCVCKSWRTVALSNRNMFMLSRQPMHIRISSRLDKNKKCSLEDLEGRKFTTILPRSSDTTFLGLVSGYVILLGWKTRYFRLVNPITRHELLFPRFPFYRVPDRPENFRCVLFFSSTMSRWVFVVSVRFSRDVSFSFSSDPANWRANSTAKWTHLDSDFPICDLHFFQGKIYALCNKGFCLSEVRLSPTPTLTLLKMKIFVNLEFIRPELTTVGEKLYVVSHHSSNRSSRIVEIEVNQMRCVKPTKALKEYALFAKINKSRVTMLEHWLGICEQYERFGTHKNDNEGIRYTKYMWYYPHKCLDVNLLLHDQ
ncbi:hypothetical protein SSX86_028182 [Deinandra increscens subsp. villosa]|uniref:F-box domain-containing protein n=1 Tax=Deinandra increscens subsp. villosa TaxID=3103831 RepID=A0AAP0GL38_9ASTR